MMVRRIAPALLLSILAASSPTAAQSYESPFRFGIGLDYAGLAGRDGGLAGLRFQLGARLHEHFALYWQGQIMGGALADPELVTVAGLGANALIAEANIGIFQLGAGPSADVTVLCDIDITENGGVEACVDRVGPGLAARAGLRFGMFTTSADLHVTFDDARDPIVWVMLGVGVQLGDVPTRPMPYGIAERVERHEPDDDRWTDEDPLDVPLSSEGRLGRALDDPRPLDDAPETPSVDTATSRAVAPARRFTRRDVESATSLSDPAAREEAPAAQDLDGRDELDFEESDDPLEGL